MNALRAHVENGRIIVDDQTDLPEGTVLHLVPVNSDDMDSEQRAALEQAIEEGYDDFENGEHEDARAYAERLLAKR